MKLINKMVWLCCLLVVVIILISIYKLAFPSTDEQLAMKPHGDTVMVEISNTDVSVICFLKDNKVESCKVVRYKGFVDCVDKYEVTPTPTITPYTKPVLPLPQQ